MIVQVTLVNDDTGEVEKTYVETIGGRTHSWEAAQALRAFFNRLFKTVFGDDNEEW